MKLSFKDFSGLQSKKLPCTHCTLSWDSIGYSLSLNEDLRIKLNQVYAWIMDIEQRRDKTHVHLILIYC